MSNDRSDAKWQEIEFHPLFSILYGENRYPTIPGGENQQDVSEIHEEAATRKELSYSSVLLLLVGLAGLGRGMRIHTLWGRFNPFWILMLRAFLEDLESPWRWEVTSRSPEGERMKENWQFGLPLVWTLHLDSWTEDCWTGLVACFLMDFRDILLGLNDWIINLVSP